MNGGRKIVIRIKSPIITISKPINLFSFMLKKDYCSFTPFERIRFVIIPRINAQAIEVIVTFPKVRVRPPIPEIRITLTTKRLRFSSRSTYLIILRPLTAIKP